MFLDELKTILHNKGESESMQDKTHLKVTKIKDGYDLEYGAMYECPALNLTHLKALSELFGTDEIDVNRYSEGGCDTCDFGSNYGNNIQITKITKNVDELEVFVGKDLYELESKRGKYAN